MKIIGQAYLEKLAKLTPTQQAILVAGLAGGGVGAAWGGGDAYANAAQREGEDQNAFNKRRRSETLQAALSGGGISGGASAGLTALLNMGRG